MMEQLWRLAEPTDDPQVVRYPQGMVPVMVRVAPLIVEDTEETRDAIGFALAASPMVWRDGNVTDDYIAQADAVVRLLRRLAAAKEG